MSSLAGVPPPTDADALLRCADEPIAIPGAIQPHGALLALTEPDLTVVVASANAAEIVGAATRLDDLLGDEDLAQVGLDDLLSAVDAGPVEPHALLDAVLDALNPPSTDDITLLCIART